MGVEKGTKAVILAIFGKCVERELALTPDLASRQLDSVPLQAQCGHETMEHNEQSAFDSVHKMKFMP